MKDGSILIIDDKKSVLSALEILLQFDYNEVKTLNNPNRISSYKNLDKVDVILLDMNFSAGVNSGNEGLFWLKEILKKAPNTSVVMMTAYGDVDLAVRAIKEGADDFILKPWDNEKLLATVQSAWSLRKSKRKVAELQEKTKNLKQVINNKQTTIIGESKQIKNALDLTRKVAKADVNVLITGENGTGKELFARELHESSERVDEVFISVDMGSISESLFESEFFGHKKGAFTDAKSDRIGKVEAADKGTLFLDEIGNLSLQMQAKLLSVIQNREIVRVGTNTPTNVDIRLICATNCDLNQMVAEGKFREDLLYRINTIHVEVPPLRDREGDIPLLAEFFLKKFGVRYDKPNLKIRESALKKLVEYKWPGNIRELQHMMERSVILCSGNTLIEEDFVLKSNASLRLENSNLSLEEMEKVLIINALNKNDRNFTAAASQLGITRQTLYNKVRKMNIDD